MNKKAVLEGLLFVVGDEGLSLEQASNVLGINGDELAQLLVQLQNDYDSPNRGIQIEILGNYLKLTTKKEHKNYYQTLFDSEENDFLSQAALETLAIVAYNEPVTRIQVDEIRGVSSSHIIRKLLAKNLIQEIGRSDLPGRPILYGITSEFLDYFGLATKEELPKLEEMDVQETDEEDLFSSKYQEMDE